ncbi:MAG: AAA family ATPase [Acetobacteraceae bacterium]|nr:AAA family ATPase [Acetobacteraceae bacterium]
MTWFSSLSVRGYRRLADLHLPLRSLNVLIGANGIGKSSVLDVLHLLGKSANKRLTATVLEAGGLKSIFTADGETSELTVAVARPATDTAGFTYELTLGEFGVFQGMEIRRERLTQVVPGTSEPLELLVKTDNGQVHYGEEGFPSEPERGFDRSESALSQSSPFSMASAFRHALGDISAIYHSLDISPRAPVRSPQILSPVSLPGPNAEFLVASLFNMRETAQDRFEAIEDSLRASFPDFERLSFQTVAAGQLGLVWKDSRFTRPFYANELSEGTLRFLWLATLLQSPDLPHVTLIDEPEVSLHPELLRLLADLMREASERTQLIVATHSDRLVRFLTPSDLVVCDQNPDGGGMTVQRADALDLDEWLQDYTLDQLWSRGIIGGRA